MRARRFAAVSAAVASIVAIAAAIAWADVAVGRTPPPMGDVPRGTGAALLAAALVLALTASWVSVHRSTSSAVGFAASVPVLVLPSLAGLATLPDPVKSLLLALPPLLVVCLLTAAGPTSGRRRRRVMVVAWGASLVAALVQLLAYDAFSDEACLRTCLPLHPLLGGLATGTQVTVAVTALTAVAASLAAVVTASGSDPLLRVGGTAAFLLLAVAVLVAARDTTFSRAGWTQQAPAVATALVAGVVLVRWAQVTRRRARVDRLARDLRTSVADDIAFADPRTGGWLDAQGRTLSPFDAQHGLLVSDVDGPVARLRSVPDGPPHALPASDDQLVSPATALVIGNAQLVAVARSQVDELRRSQQRIVTAADDERTRLGRDLHDRTQQRLVGASLHLRLAAARADDPQLASALLASESRLSPALAALRAASHGRFPDVLAEEGLASALDELRRDPQWTARVVAPTRLDRAPADQERAAYALLISADAGSTEFATVSGRLHVTARDVTHRDDPAMIDALDRVGAAGGAVTWTDDHRTLTAEFAATPDADVDGS